MGADHPAQGSFAPASLTGRRPPIERWALLAAVFLVVVVTKPWGATEGDQGTGQLPSTARRSLPLSPAPTPSHTKAVVDLEVTAFCLDNRSWLVASVERSLERSTDRQIRVWRALEPAASAVGPEDSRIPVVSVVTEGLTELGWCAPTADGEIVSPTADVDAWVRAPDGARPIVLESSRPVSDTSPYGALYRPPGKGPSSKAAFWPNGTYVFRYREANARQRWFAIDVETRPVASATP